MNARPVAGLLAFVFGIAFGPGPAIAAGNASFSAERVQSQEALQEMLQAHKVVIHSHYYPLLERIRYRLVSTPTVRNDIIAKGYTINFVIVRDPAPNAFATPGGVIFVTDSLLPLLRSEDELASILAHEVGHVVLEHAQDKEKKTALFVYGNLAAAFLLKSPGQRNLVFFTSLYGYLNFDRQTEFQADHEGAMLLAQAHYDPWAMIWSFQRFESAFGDSGFESYVSDHPSFAQRSDRIHDYITATPAFARFRNREAAASGLPTSVPGAPFLVIFPGGSTSGN